VALALELGQGHAPAHDGVALALPGQARQDVARHLTAVGIEPLVGALGQPRDRTVDAARVLVRAEAQAAAVAVLPELEQRRGQQRQRTGLALDIGDQRIDEGRLKAPGRRGGRGAQSPGAR
jgi:hypothetical protein